eukprot:6339456-Prymnesium_polylepis.1
MLHYLPVNRLSPRTASQACFCRPVCARSQVQIAENHPQSTHSMLIRREGRPQRFGKGIRPF